MIYPTLRIVDGEVYLVVDNVYSRHFMTIDTIELLWFIY